PPEHHDEEHRSERADPTTVAAASSMEATRIRSLIADLDATRTEIAGEARQLAGEQATLEGALRDLTSTLTASLRPQGRELTDLIRTIRDERDRVRRALDLYKQLEQVEALADGLEGAAQPTASQPSPEASASDLEAFAQ